MCPESIICEPICQNVSIVRPNLQTGPAACLRVHNNEPRLTKSLEGEDRVLLGNTNLKLDNLEIQEIVSNQE